MISKVNLVSNETGICSISKVGYGILSRIRMATCGIVSESHLEQHRRDRDENALNKGWDQK